MTFELGLHASTVILIALIIILWRKASTVLMVAAIIFALLTFIGGFAFSYNERMSVTASECSVRHMHALTGSYVQLCYDGNGRVFVAKP